MSEKPNASHLAGLILARDQLPLGVIAASEAESLIAQAMAAPATSHSQVAADPMAMIDLRVEALKASPWGEHADRTGAFVKGALWHAMRNGSQVAAAITYVRGMVAAAAGQPSVATGYLSDILDVLTSANGSQVAAEVVQVPRELLADAHDWLVVMRNNGSEAQKRNLRAIIPNLRALLATSQGSVMAFFIMEYRVKGYGIDHAFSRDPKCGRRKFFVSGDSIGTDDLDEVKRLAALPESTPEGYELFSVRDRDAKQEQSE